MKHKNLIFVSSLVHPWGGSEELWKQSAIILKNLGHQITVCKENVDYTIPAVIDLVQNNIKIIELSYPSRYLYQKIYKKAIQFFKRKEVFHANFSKHLLKQKPDFVVVAQSMNFDGICYAAACLSKKIPYVIISQKAVETRWLLPQERAITIKAFENAKACFFVSKHNLKLTEEQLGKRLTNAEIVFNPIKVNRNILPLPTSDTISFACIGRLCILDKGQDILLRILSRPIWKNRNYQLSFIGAGVDEVGLKAMAILLEVKNVKFISHIADIENIWEKYHALVLPSRYEGLPLAIMEAMALGRTVITTNAGGNIEVIENGVTGFIGEANENDFAVTLENAWNKRNEWEIIGKNAYNFIKNNVPSFPEEDFANRLLNLVNG